MSGKPSGFAVSVSGTKTSLSWKTVKGATVNIAGLGAFTKELSRRTGK